MLIYEYINIVSFLSLVCKIISLQYRPFSSESNIKISLLFPNTYPPSLWFTRLGFYTSVLFKKTNYIAKQSSKTDRWWPL